MNPVRQALYTKLSGTSAITSKVGSRIYHAQAPADAAYPYIIFNRQSGTKMRAFQEPEAFKREVWLVKAVDRNTTSNAAEDVALAVDAALDGGTLTVSGKTLADLHHISDVDYLEPSGDQQFRHHCANYAVVTTD